MKIESLLRVRQIIREHADQLEANRAFLQSIMHVPAQPGDLYCLFPLLDHLPVRLRQQVQNNLVSYLILSTHPDDESLFFVVPVDQVTFLVGVADVEIRNGIARCGYGLWLSRSHFTGQHRCAVSDPADLKKCRQKMADLARGQVKSTEEAEAVECDPEYQHHCANLDLLVDALNQSV